MDKEDELAKLIAEQAKDDRDYQEPEKVHGRRVLSLDAQAEGDDHQRGEDFSNAHPIWGGETIPALYALPAVEAVLDRLPTADQALLEQRILERMTLQEIATENGTTRQAVQQRLATAERRFRREWTALYPKKEGADDDR